MKVLHVINTAEVGGGGSHLIQLAQGLAFGELGRELRTELRLPARTLQEEDEIRRDGERYAPPEILLHEGQDQIHAGRAPR